MRVHAIIASVALAGCASMEPQLGFDDVARDVQARTGMRVHWNSGSQEDREAERAVAEMLARQIAVDDAVQIALLNNRGLQALYEELNIAQADVVQAGLLRNPVFSAEVRFATAGAGGPAVVLDVAQDFISLLSMPLRKGRAEAAFETAKLRVTGAVLDVAGDVRIAFYEYQASQQTEELRRTVLEATSASLELAKRLRDAGNITALDVANERALNADAQLRLTVAQDEAIQARERMNELMGLTGGQLAWRAAPRLQPPSDPIDAASLEERAIESSLDLAIARREVDVASRELGIAKPFGWLTDAEIGVASERELESAWSVGPSIALPIPLFDQGQAAIGGAEARLRQARETYLARIVEVRARTRAARSAVASARDRVQTFEGDVLPVREEILHETQLQYNAMQVSAFQLLEAKRDQIDAGGNYIEALRDYWMARARLDLVLSGRLPPSDVRRVTEVTARSEGN